MLFTIHVIDNAGNEIGDPGGYRTVNYLAQGVACPATITNWKGEYWTNTSLSGPAAVCRDDTTVQFDWGAGSPHAYIPADNFSARWTRTVNFQSNAYIFHVGHDDGVRLYIDDQLMMDKWTSCCGPDQVMVSLSGGNHTVRLELNEIGGYARVELWWEPVNITGWRGEFFSNQNWVGNPVVVRDDADINFSWQANKPDPLVPDDHFSVRWTKNVSFPAGSYRFFIYHDDGSRLTIDGSVKQENLCTDCYLTDTADVDLSLGNHAVKLEIFDNLGWATARLRWLSKFNKTYPANAATGVNSSPTISWAVSNGATSYVYCYDTVNNNACDASWISNGTNLTAALSGLASNTTYYWQVRATNDGGTLSANNDIWSQFTTSGSNGGSCTISINNGALFTNQTQVTLSLTAPAGTTDMQVSNDGGFAGVNWETFAASRLWTVTQYGTYVIPRTVYVRYRDSNSNVTSNCQDDIVLDVTAPTGGISLAGSVGQQPAALNVTLNLSAMDDASGVGWMMISHRADFIGAAWEEYALTKAWALSTPTVYVRFKDNAGNISPIYSTNQYNVFLPLTKK